MQIKLDCIRLTLYVSLILCNYLHSVASYSNNMVFNVLAGSCKENVYGYKYNSKRLRPIYRHRSDVCKIYLHELMCRTVYPYLYQWRHRQFLKDFIKGLILSFRYKSVNFVHKFNNNCCQMGFLSRNTLKLMSMGAYSASAVLLSDVKGADSRKGMQGEGRKGLKMDQRNSDGKGGRERREIAPWLLGIDAPADIQLFDETILVILVSVYLCFGPESCIFSIVYIFIFSF